MESTPHSPPPLPSTQHVCVVVLAGCIGGVESGPSSWQSQLCVACPGQVRKGVGKVTALCGQSGAGEEGGRQSDSSVWPLRGR